MAGPAYEWGTWRFEPTECRLLRDGVQVSMHAKSLDLLATLLRRAPRLVTKEEILAAVWADAAVEEGNIAFHVAALRKVLDEGAEQSAIETVRGRGYRFVQPVAIGQMQPTAELQQEAAAAVSRASAASPVSPALPAQPALEIAAPRAINGKVVALVALVIAAIGGFAWYRLSAPPSASVAIQPFEIVNPRAGQENFSDGMIAYLTTSLERRQVIVAPRERATVILTGQLHPTDQGFRVTVQLSAAGDNARLWDWSFNVSADEERPPASAGPDDERSRMQGIIAGRTADGVQRYFSLGGAEPVTR
jgi:DNA-binding winged helix-turn-helix (wHTH) protein/TolB-like protein